MQGILDEWILLNPIHNGIIWGGVLGIFLLLITLKTMLHYSRTINLQTQIMKTRTARIETNNIEELEKRQKDEIKKIKDIKKNLILEQYKRCTEDWRYYDRLLWQIPFTTATVIGAILALIYSDVGGTITFSSELKISLLSCLLILVITMFFLNRKIRFFQEGRTRFAAHLEQRVGIENLPIRTSDVFDFLSHRDEAKTLIKFRVIHFQNLLFGAYTGTLGFLLFIEGHWG